jgi:hypothetical protein
MQGQGREDGGRRPLDLKSLRELWAERWPGCRPVSYELRSCAFDRWVRFHGLPGSQRYANNEAEYRELLSRHNHMVRDLADGTGPPERLLVMIFPKWASPCEMSRDPLELVREGAYWFTIDREDDDARMDLYVCRVLFPSTRLDGLLRRVADGALGGVILCDPGLTWLYAPYDGGCDVIAPSPDERDRLRQRYAS